MACMIAPKPPKTAGNTTIDGPLHDETTKALQFWHSAITFDVQAAPLCCVSFLSGHLKYRRVFKHLMACAATSC